jgi:hypothetical protein
MPVKQFGFAWLSAEDETFNGSQFRMDEQVISWTVTGNEGDCDSLEIVIKNPKRGLLNGSIWASLSYGTSTGDAVEIYRGRLTAIPEDIVGETVDLMFIAKPSSYDQQLATLAAELRALPPYDAAWVDPDKRDDPMAVLECQSALYFVDRVAHTMSITDIIWGEDGIVAVTPDDILYDSLKCGSAGDPPLTAVTMIGHASWKQVAAGGFMVPNAWGSRSVLNGESLVSSWPKSGSTVAGGYKVTTGFCTDDLNLKTLTPVQKNWSYENRAKQHTVGDVMSSTLTYTIFPAGGNLFYSNIKTQTGSVPAAQVVAYQETEGGGYTQYDPYASIDGSSSDQVMIPLHVSYNAIMIPIWRISYGLSLSIDTNANAGETIQFTIHADLQPIVTLPDPTVVQTTIELSTQDLTSDQGAGNPSGEITSGVGPPLDSTSDSFAGTDRGAYAIGYLVAVGRAAIRKASRAVSCTGTVVFEKALEFSLRKNALVQDQRLPSGECIGKITAYSFGFANGVASGTFEILPAVGQADIGLVVVEPPTGSPPGTPPTVTVTPGEGTVTPVAGTDVYADAYADNYTQTTGGTMLIPGAGGVLRDVFGDIGYGIDAYTPGGISALTAADCVLQAEWQTDGVSVEVGHDDMPNGSTRVTTFDAPWEKFHLVLKPSNSIDLSALPPVTVTPLNVAKQIDLSAAPL